MIIIKYKIGGRDDIVEVDREADQEEEDQFQETEDIEEEDLLLQDRDHTVIEGNQREVDLLPLQEIIERDQSQAEINHLMRRNTDQMTKKKKTEKMRENIVIIESNQQEVPDQGHLRKNKMNSLVIVNNSYKY